MRFATYDTDSQEPTATVPAGHKVWTLSERNFPVVLSAHTAGDDVLAAYVMNADEAERIGQALIRSAAVVRARDAEAEAVFHA